MAYIKFVDELPSVVRKVLSIFLPIIFVVYRLILDVEKSNTTLIILDIVFGIFPFAIIFWIVNMISIFKEDKVGTFEKSYVVEEEKEEEKSE